MLELKKVNSLVHPNNTQNKEQIVADALAKINTLDNEASNLDADGNIKITYYNEVINLSNSNRLLVFSTEAQSRHTLPEYFEFQASGTSEEPTEGLGRPTVTITEDLDDDMILQIAEQEEISILTIKIELPEGTTIADKLRIIGENNSESIISITENMIINGHTITTNVPASGTTFQLNAEIIKGDLVTIETIPIPDAPTAIFFLNDNNNDDKIDNSEAFVFTQIKVEVAQNAIIGNTLNITTSKGTETNIVITQDIIDNGHTINAEALVEGETLTVYAKIINQYNKSSSNISNSIERIGEAPVSMGTNYVDAISYDNPYIWTVIDWNIGIGSNTMIPAITTGQTIKIIMNNGGEFVATAEKDMEANSLLLFIDSLRYNSKVFNLYTSKGKPWVIQDIVDYSPAKWPPSGPSNDSCIIEKNDIQGLYIYDGSAGGPITTYSSNYWGGIINSDNVDSKFISLGTNDDGVSIGNFGSNYIGSYKSGITSVIFITNSHKIEIIAKYDSGSTNTGYSFIGAILKHNDIELVNTFTNKYFTSSTQRDFLDDILDEFTISPGSTPIMTIEGKDYYDSIAIYPQSSKVLGVYKGTISFS